MDFEAAIQRLTFDRDMRNEMRHLVRMAMQAEREACAKIADYRAAICREAMSGPPESLPGVEVHTMNEALHIATMIRNRTTTS